MLYKNVSKIVDEMFPEWLLSAEYEASEPPLPYVQFGSLTSYIISVLKSSNYNNSEIIERYFNLLNSMLESNDDVISTLAFLEGAENLIQQKEVFDFSFNKFNTSTKKDILKQYNNIPYVSSKENYAKN